MVFAGDIRKRKLIFMLVFDGLDKDICCFAFKIGIPSFFWLWQFLRPLVFGLLFRKLKKCSPSLATLSFGDYYGSVDESKKPTKKVRPLKLYELRLSVNPYGSFQMGPITRRSTFLRLLKKEDDSYRVVWLYSSNKKRLANFLLQVVCYLSLNTEFEIIKEKNKKDLEDYDFSELCTLALTKSLFGDRGIAPETFAQLMQGENEFRSAINKNEDLNLASVGLMNATSTFYYSLTWNFYDYAGALKALQEAVHLPVNKIETSTLALDKTL